MSLKGVVFDKDGTLTNFHATWMEAYRQAAERLAAESASGLTTDAMLAVGGYDSVSQRCLPTSLLACGSTGEIAELWASHSGIGYAQVLQWIEEVFSRQAAAKPVAAAALDPLFHTLRDLGLKLGVATMDSESLAHETLQRLAVSHHFDFVCGYDSGFGIKPEPGMVEAFCAEFALHPQEIVMVGDTLHDIRMGRAANALLCIGVLSGASERNLLESEADIVVDDIGQLPAVVSALV